MYFNNIIYYTLCTSLLFFKYLTDFFLIFQDELSPATVVHFPLISTSYGWYISTMHLLCILGYLQILFWCVRNIAKTL